MTHVCQVSLSAFTGSDAVAYGGEALDGLDGDPDELERLRPLGAASVNIHKCQRARGWGKKSFTPFKSKVWR